MYIFVGEFSQRKWRLSVRIFCCDAPKILFLKKLDLMMDYVRNCRLLLFCLFEYNSLIV